MVFRYWVRGVSVGFGVDVRFCVFWDFVWFIVLLGRRFEFRRIFALFLGVFVVFISVFF